MKRDPIVMGENYVLSGDDVSRTRPNNNVLIDGATGVGKSKSIVLPTMGRMEHSNNILNYAKAYDACEMVAFLESKGVTVRLLNLARAEQSNIGFDPLRSVQSYEDIDTLASAIVNAAISKTVDDYWQAKARPLLSALMEAAIMDAAADEQPSMRDVLQLFDRMQLYEKGSRVCTPLDGLFDMLEKAVPNNRASREYRNWSSLPDKTASCVRDTLAAALSTCFPEGIRRVMCEKPSLDVERFANNREAIVIVSSALEPAQQFYLNLFYRDLNHALLRYAARCPRGELPREVRFIFDDFACTAPIDGFGHDLSLFRAAGISAIMLLQSQSQLEAIYKDDAAAIRQNCAVHAYFPGGFDDRSCDIVSKRLGLPYEEILYAPMGNLFVMESGKKPVRISRYDSFHSPEYAAFCAAQKGKEGSLNAKTREGNA